MKRTLLYLSAMLLTLGTQAAVKQTIWDLSVETNQNAAATETGYTQDGETLFAKDTARTAYGTYGFNIFPYNMSGNLNVNNHYIKFTLKGDTKDTIALTVREGSTGARVWTLYYKMMPKGTALTEALTTNATIYSVIDRPKISCRILTLDTVAFDLTGKGDQDIYFFQTCNETGAGKNQLSFRTIDWKEVSKDKDTNTALKSIYYEGIEYPTDAKVLYGNIANATAKLYGDAESITASIDTVVVTNPLTKGATVEASLVVTAENGNKQTYTYTIMGAEWQKSTFVMNGLTDTDPTFCAQFKESLKDTVINNIKFACKHVKAGSGEHNVNFNGTGCYVADVNSATNGENAFVMTIPANAVGYMNEVVRCTSNGKAINLYAYNVATGTVVSSVKDQIASAIAMGVIGNSVKDTNYKMEPCFVDYSTVDTPQDVYFFQSGSGVRYRELTFTQFITKGSTTSIDEAQTTKPTVKKMIINGQMMILKNDVLYNAQGAIVK